METKKNVVCPTELRAKRKISYHKIRKRDGNKCQVCDWRGKEAHHIVPIMYGGEDTMENMVWLCRECHKHTPHTKEEFEAYKLTGGRRRLRILGLAAFMALKDKTLDMRECVELAQQLYNSLAEASLTEDDYEPIEQNEN